MLADYTENVGKVPFLGLFETLNFLKHLNLERPLPYDLFCPMLKEKLPKRKNQKLLLAREFVAMFVKKSSQIKQGYRSTMRRYQRAVLSFDDIIPYET